MNFFQTLCFNLQALRALFTILAIRYRKKYNLVRWPVNILFDIIKLELDSGQRKKVIFLFPIAPDRTLFFQPKRIDIVLICKRKKKKKKKKKKSLCGYSSETRRWGASLEYSQGRKIFTRYPAYLDLLSIKQTHKQTNKYFFFFA